MLIKEFHKDVVTASGETMRIFITHPSISNRPHAKFPGVVVFSEIYQVTGPVARFARQIAGQGYICAAPSSFHGFEGPEPLAYDGPGTDRGNELKITKVDRWVDIPAYLSAQANGGWGWVGQTVESYDEDATLAIDLLLSLRTCDGVIGATGMCLGGHLAFRCAMDARVSSAVCYFATDIHSHSLGAGKSDNSLQRVAAGDLGHAEVAMIFGKLDGHVPAGGRDLIRRSLHEAGAVFSFYELAWSQHAYAHPPPPKIPPLPE